MEASKLTMTPSTMQLPGANIRTFSVRATSLNSARNSVRTGPLSEQTLALPTPKPSSLSSNSSSSSSSPSPSVVRSKQKHADGNLEIELESVEVAPGGILRGVVRLELHSAISTKGVRIHIKGEEVSVITLQTPRTVVYKKTNKHLSIVKTLIGADISHRDEVEPLVLDTQANNEWSFEHHLSIYDPPSFHGGQSSVSYSLRAYVDLGGNDIIATTPFEVSAIYPAELVSIWAAPPLQEITQEFPFSGKNIQVKGTLAKNVHVPGDTVVATFEIDNQSDKSVKSARARLRQSVIFCAKNERGEHFEVLANQKLNHVEVPSRSQKTVDVELQLPATITLPSLQGSLITVVYQVRFVLELGWGRTSEAILPFYVVLEMPEGMDGMSDVAATRLRKALNTQPDKGLLAKTQGKTRGWRMSIAV